MMKKNILLLLLSFCGIISNAQLIIDGQFRPRTELRNGYSQPRSNNLSPAFFTTQRTRLGIKHIGNGITSKINLQDYRVWGEDKIKTDIPSLGLYEAYVSVDLSAKSFITLGRQSFNIDNKRFFSSANWNQLGASHDGITIDYKNENFVFKMFTAFNQTKVSNFGIDYSAQISNYKFLNTIWAQKKFKNLSIANLTITDSYQKVGTTTVDYFRVTSGIVLIKSTDKNNIELRGFYQAGKSKIGQNISAYYASILLLHKFNSNFKFSFGTEYLSGNDMTNSNNIDNSFDILYGSKHWTNGMLDYFSTPSTTKNAGLINPYCKFDLNLKNDNKLSLYYHYFMLSNNYVSKDEVVNPFLAHELDFVLDKKINEISNLQIGYGILYGSETLEIIKGGDSNLINSFAFAMLTIKPVFLNK